MRAVFVAIWYDPKKCEANAIKAGWDPACGDGFLDIYFPEEDPKGHEEKEFSSLDPAVSFLRQIVADGKDFWGQGRVNKFEVGGRRCKYCTCRGWNCIHTYIVEAEGVVEDHTEDNCCGED